jgi:hypothetical protein
MVPRPAKQLRQLIAVRKSPAIWAILAAEEVQIKFCSAIEFYLAKHLMVRPMRKAASIANLSRGPNYSPQSGLIAKSVRAFHRQG